MLHTGRRVRWLAVALTTLVVAVSAAAPVAAKAPTRSIPVEPSDAYTNVLFGGLAAVARDPLKSRQLTGVADRQGASGRELAVTIDVAAQSTLDAIRDLGVRIVNRTNLQVEAYVAASSLARLAAVPGVVRVAPILRKRIDTITSAGVHIQGADIWQTAGFTGAGVKIGIIDGGFQGIRSLVGTELPLTIHARCFTAVGSFTANLADCENGVDHGTGVAETALDMAPGVTLYIADPESYGDDRAVISWMTSEGVRIINASFASGAMFEGPGDGTAPLPGSVYEDVNQAAAAGALWVNSAGNHAETGWTGPWLDADANNFLEFVPGDENNTLHMVAGENISAAIRWAEPWGTAKANYNVAIYAAGGTTALASGSPLAAGVPQRFFSFTASATGDYDIAIIRLSGAATTRMQLLVGSEYPFALSHNVMAGTLPSPADSKNAGMISVGAVDIASLDRIETFSSQGPTVDNRIKPDISGSDCALTAIFGQFCGTSAAAPHVTGGAALVLQANPAFTTAQIITFLKSRATPIGTPVPNNQAGYGLMNLGVPPPPPPGAPKALEFQVQPAGAPATLPLVTQPVVRVVDAASTTVASGPGSTTDVTLALGVNPGGATLTCTGGLTRAAVAGVATFAGCTVSTQGTGYTLVASASGLTSATSNAFDMAVPPPPIPLAFQAVPADGPANTPLTPTVMVKVVDPSDPAGGTLATGAASTAPITIALAANASSATLSCSGGRTAVAVAGVATFTGCRISAAGTGYTLVATSPGLVQTTSTAFNQTDAPTAATLGLSSTATAIVWGTGVTLAVHLAGPAAGPTAAGRAVHLQSSLDGQAWSTILDLTTNGTGDAATAYRPVTNLFYRAVFDGAVDLGGVTSATKRVTVRETISLRPDNAGKVKVVKKGATVKFTITVRPARPDVPPGRVSIQLYRLFGTTWRLQQTIGVQPSATGTALFILDFGTIATSYYLRASAQPTAVNANSLWTPNVRYDVR